MIEHGKVAVALGNVLEADDRLYRFGFLHGRGLLRMQRGRVAVP